MEDFIQDFLDWFVDFLNNIFENGWAAIKVAVIFLIWILLLPLWILPFIYWLFIERRKH